jgi:hypothetical protein
VNEFNGHVQGLQEGGTPDKEAMKALADKIAAETAKLIKKLSHVKDLIGEAIDRARVMKKSNYEKGNYLADRMTDWANFTTTVDSELRNVSKNKENIQAWQEWLAQDPPPLPPEMVEPMGGVFPDPAPVRVEWEAVARARMDQHAMPLHASAEELRPFLDRAADLFPDGESVTLVVYGDMNHRMAYFRTNQYAAFQVVDSRASGLEHGKASSPNHTLHTSQSSILRVVMAEDADRAFMDEISAGQLYVEDNETALLAQLARLAAEVREAKEDRSGGLPAPSLIALVIAIMVIAAWRRR